MFYMKYFEELSFNHFAYTDFRALKLILSIIYNARSIYVVKSWGNALCERFVKVVLNSKKYILMYSILHKAL